MKKMSSRIVVLALLVAVGAACSGDSPAETTASVPADTGPVDDPGANGDEWAAIEEAASEEGAVTVYASAGEAAIQQIVDSFMEDYPDITAEFFRAPGAELLGRYASEAEAGNVTADVFMPAVEPDFVESNSEWFIEITDELIPEASEWPSEFRTGLRLEVAVEPVIMTYNSDLVDSAPGTWAEALDIGSDDELLLIDPRASAGYLSWFHIIREELGDDFLTQIPDMGVQWIDGGGPAAQEVAAGTSPAAFPMYPSHTVALQASGAPIEIVHDLDPTQGLTTTVALSADSPNPNAARVFANWLASDAGRQVLCSLEVYSSVRDGETPCPEVPSNYVPAVYGISDDERAEILTLIGLEE